MFLKFGEETHIRDFYENGTVFINTIEKHRKAEDEFLRGDKYEGASRIINSLPGKLKIPGVEREFNYNKIHLTESYEEVLGNIFSLYCISSHGFDKPEDFRIDKKNKRFGTHCLMVKDNEYFLSAIESALNNRGYQFHHGFVNYYDKNTENKELSLFEKPLEYEYQKEFRIYVENDCLEPIKISIGSLASYSEIHLTEDIMNLSLSNSKS